MQQKERNLDFCNSDRNDGCRFTGMLASKCAGFRAPACRMAARLMAGSRPRRFLTVEASAAIEGQENRMYADFTVYKVCCQDRIGTRALWFACHKSPLAQPCCPHMLPTDTPTMCMHAFVPQHTPTQHTHTTAWHTHTTAGQGRCEFQGHSPHMEASYQRQRDPRLAGGGGGGVACTVL